jgi:uncharacterized protein (TIGR02246 family)
MAADSFQNPAPQEAMNMARIADDVVQQWISAFNANDAAALAKLYAKDAILLPTLNPVMANDAASIHGYFDWVLGSKFKVSLGEYKAIPMGDDAIIITGFYDFLVKPDTPLPARFSFVIVKRGNEWLIVHHHSSRKPEPP